MGAPVFICVGNFVVNLFVAGRLWPRWVLDRVKERSEGKTHTALFKVLCLGTCVGLLQIALHLFTTTAHGEVFGIPFNFGSSLLYPLALVVPLFVVFAGTPGVLLFITAAILGGNSLTYLLVLGINNGVISNGFPTAFDPAWRPEVLGPIFWGTILQVCEIPLMIVVLLKLGRGAVSRRVQFIAPLLIVLFLDSLIYSWVLSLALGKSYLLVLFGQLLFKMASGAVYALLVVSHVETSSKDVVWRDTPEGIKAYLGDVWGLIQKFGSTMATVVGRGTRDPMSSHIQEERRFDLDNDKDAPTEMELSIAQFDKDFPELMETHKDKWVSYRAGKRVTIADTKGEAFEAARAADKPDNTIFVVKIRPHCSEVYVDFGKITAHPL